DAGQAGRAQLDAAAPLARRARRYGLPARIRPMNFPPSRRLSGRRREGQVTEIAEWVAPIATMIAALMTASNLGPRVTGWGFVVFTIGAIAWALIGLTTGQSNLLWQNVL